MTSGIAVVGMACTFPGAPDYRSYWDLLRTGRVAIREVPTTRWRWDGYWGDPRSGHSRCDSRWGGFIDGFDTFDFQFFRISRREGEAMDPQQRLALSLAWSCLEDAAIRPSSLAGRRVGVFVGVMNVDYKTIVEGRGGHIDSYHETGLQCCVIPNRISHWFHFTGPSLPLDTACSSSLYAIHAGCQSLRSGECELAMVGGVNLLLTSCSTVAAGQMGILSPTGAVRAFDACADGTVLGEGGGMLLLKPYDRAAADGNRILAVIKGSAVNHCGRTASLTYPSASAQADVIRRAHEAAGTVPREVSYVEAHGTGTPKGDPIEIEGLKTAFGVDGHAAAEIDGWRCGIGTVKPNIGHLLAAAGVAGAIKVVLSLQHRELVPQPHFRTPHPEISLGGTGLFIVDRHRPWTPTATADGQEPTPRMAGISGFGFSGTNVHIVVAEAPGPQTPLAELDRQAARTNGGESPAEYVIVLSARTEVALQERARQLHDAVLRDGLTDADLPAIVRTLRIGREPMPHRLACRTGSMNELKRQLREYAEGRRTGARVRYGNADVPSAGSPAALTAGSAEPLAAWTSGAMSDLPDLQEDAPAPLLGLPSYPFAATHCWASADA